MGKGTRMKKMLTILLVMGCVVVSSPCPECDGLVGHHEAYCSESEVTELVTEVTQVTEKVTEETKKEVKRSEKKVKKWYWADLGNFEITSYCACSYCSSGTGITKSGRPATPNKTIGVDESLIPLGSEVKIVFADGTEGVYSADDTGSAIHGNIIDLFMASHDEALQFGRQKCRVYIKERNEGTN